MEPGRAKYPAARALALAVVVTLGSVAWADATVGTTMAAQTTVAPPQPATGFGVSLAADGDLVAVGAPIAVTGEVASGIVYLYRSGADGAWTEEAALVPSDARAAMQFGRSVAVDGDLVAVGAPLDDTSGSAAGAVYVFERADGMWVERQKLTSATSSGPARFGSSVAVDGDRMAIGAYLDSEAGVFTGAAYVFERRDGSWTQATKLIAQDARSNDQFGWAVALSGEHVLVGAYQYGNDYAYSGAAYLFAPSADADGFWDEVAFFLPEGLRENDRFGVSVAIDGDRAVVGAWLADVAAPEAGAAYVFERHDGEWVEAARIHAPDGTPRARFGLSVAVQDERIAVGAYQAISDELPAGAVYLFDLIDGAWRVAERLEPEPATPGLQFGHAVALAAETVAITAWSGAGDAERPERLYLFGP